MSDPARYLISSLWSKNLNEYVSELYAAGTPIITDLTYDILSKEFPTESVGAKPSSQFEKVKHTVPMGSLNKAQNETDIDNWIKSLGRDCWSLVVSDKLDGISVSVEYKEGKFVRAATRGDGTYGEEISRNVMVMKGVKLRLPENFTGFLRGEIVVKKSDFHNFPGASNPRNSAAGAAKQLYDTSKAKFCTVLFYRIIPYQTSKLEEFAKLKSWGLETPNIYRADDRGDISLIYNGYIKKTRQQLDYDIDGLVIEVDDTEKAFHIGTDPLHPEYAIAYKFPHAEGETTLRAVEWQVGNTGRITPVAVFDEIPLAGAHINRASLATVGLLRSKKLEIGSKIIVSRRNDVIPMVERALSSGTSPVNIPTNCPSCGHKLESEGEYLLCPNVGACPAQLQGAILNYTKKIGVLEWGDTIVKGICDAGLVEDLAGIYELDIDDLASLQLESGRIVGEKTAEKMLDNLEEKNALLLHVFVGALGIKGVGRTICKLIVDAGYDTLDEMLSADPFDLSEIAGVGPIRAEEFCAGLAERESMISRMLDHVEILPPVEGDLSGKSFCLTGFRDNEMIAEIERQGGTIKSSVSKGLDYLVQKDPKSVSSKSMKALEYGTEIISIEDMLEMLGK